MQSILLIDDEPKVFQDVLSLYGYDVEVAMDGYQGIQTLFENCNRFDMVILDVQMPKMDGWSVLKAIRNGSECPDMPVMMLTSEDEEDSIVKGLRRGADEYLVKPITPKRLLAHIEALARRVERQQDKQSDPELDAVKLSVRLLTPRENEILKLIVQGFSNQNIADKLVISETTVKNHLASIFKKLNVSNRTQAAYFAQKLHL